MSTSTPAYNAKKAWFVTIIVIVVATFAGCVTFRQMTVVPLLTSYFGIDTAYYGNINALVSIFTMVGALCSGFIMAKIGPRKLMITCVIFFILSIILQICAAYMGAGFVLFCFLNIFGSLAYGAWMTAPPIVIAAWFPAEKRGFPNSIAATWISFAMMLVLTFSSPLVSLGGDSAIAWINLWWALLICMVIGLVLLLLFAKMPNQADSFLETAESTGQKVTWLDGLKNGGVWMLILMFLTFGFATAAFGNYFPTYLNADSSIGGFGIDLTLANSYSSISSWVMIVMGFVWGFVLNKIPNRDYAKLCLVVIILTAVAGILMFDLPGISWIIPYMVFWGIVSRLFPPVCFTILPEICETQEECSVSNGILSLVSNGIGTLATSICGMCAVISWNTVAIPATIFGVIGLIAGIAMLPIYKRKFTAHRAAAGETI